jgi:HEAT repeat protein
MKSAVALFLSVGFAVAALEEKKVEPLYGGVPLTTLLENAVQRRVPREVPITTGLVPWMRDPEAEDAVRRTGTNALTYLIEMIQEDPHARAELAMNAFRLLGGTASPAIPALERVAQLSSSEEVRSRAVWALHYTGTNALPALARLATDTTTRMDAITGIIDLGVQGVAVGSVLEDILKQGDLAAEMAVFGLRRFEPTNALPILTNVLQHPKVSMRKMAVKVIDHFDTFARPAVPALTQCLYDSDAEVRNGAADTLRRLAPEMFVTNSPSRILQTISNNSAK